MPFSFSLASAAVAPHPAMIVPFIVMLLAIAAMPFINRHWWEQHYPKVSVALAAITIVYYLLFLQHPVRMLHVAHEYVSFIALIGSLFVVSGGIHIKTKGEATPAFNCAFLLCGAIISNFIGTTGASMLLIRPWIRMNKYRITAFHIVFFIFIVSNAGGCLTPIGDPPLFLGYLKGIPFWWTFEACWIAWAIVILILLAIFYVFDVRNFHRAPREIRQMETQFHSWRIDGLRNIGFLALILVAVFVRHPAGVSEALMIAAAVGSYFATPRLIHDANEFNFHPIKEVAWLFFGIFATMVPALDYLETNAGKLGFSSEMAFYWATGSLSGVLDNAPTYLTFMATALGQRGLSIENPDHVRQLLTIDDHQVVAISLGAVFFGAMTYIGNGPNFMVKAIADHSKVRTPGFFPYLFRYAIPILLPVFALVSLLFFSRWKVF